MFGQTCLSLVCSANMVNSKDKNNHKWRGYREGIVVLNFQLCLT